MTEKHSVYVKIDSKVTNRSEIEQAINQAWWLLNDGYRLIQSTDNECYL